MQQVVALIPDLFFATRVRSVGERSGVPLTVVASQSALQQTLGEMAPGLVILDLAARGVDVAAAIRSAKESGAKVIAFGPHKDLTARAAALEAGADEWVTNQRLLETLPDRLKNFA